MPSQNPPSKNNNAVIVVNNDGIDCEEQEVIEEVWDFGDGFFSNGGGGSDDNNINNINNNTNMETHVIRIRRNGSKDDGNNDNCLIYRSVATHQLTPLDMTYGGDDNDNDNDNDDTNDIDDDDNTNNNNNTNEYYDGTGTIVWMAALVILPVILISPPERKLGDKYPYFEGRRVCELGCGAGVAGMTIWKFCNPSLLVFTDNDPKALKLCQENCQLNNNNNSDHSNNNNNMDKVRYELLEWVQNEDGTNNNNNNNNINNNSSTNALSSSSSSLFMNETAGTFDTVVATDVLYEIIMIPPLLETAVQLLKKDGSFWLSHVPRFYLPKDHQDQQQADSDGTAAAIALEHHVQMEAKKVGLTLVETIRPNQLIELAAMTLEEESSISISSSSTSYFSLEKLNEMHAVVFLFQKRTRR